MNAIMKESIWQQFGASIDYLEDTIRSCPHQIWEYSLWETPDTEPEFSQFWYVAYHTLFWLDLYLTGTEDGFLPPPPFTLIEQDKKGPLPDVVYGKERVLDYLSLCRKTCYKTIQSLTDEMSQKRCVFSWGECSFFELLIYNMRHVHGHASQLNMLLGQQSDVQPDYVTQSRDKM